jgi:hypothetical protein
MVMKLPSPIADYLVAENTQDVDALVACFTDAAVVHDEGHDRRGPAAIRAWKEETRRKYQATIEALSVVEADGKTVLRGLVSGNFPGSPVELGFTFAFEGDKIASLEIH